MKTLIERMAMVALLAGFSAGTSACVIYADGESEPCGDYHRGYDDDDDDWDDDDEWANWGWHDDGCRDSSNNHTSVDDYGDSNGGYDDGDGYGGGGYDGGSDGGGDGTDDDDCTQTTVVCGEDGVTYDTPCAANRAHVRVQHEGECGPACAVSTDCAIYEACGSHGACEPVVCPEVTDPVCGADGVTYPSECDASAHHIAIDYTGECVPDCQVDSDCGPSELCEEGACVEADCPVLDADDHSQEVCAEDGFTYQTSCHARLARLSIAHEGCCVE